MDTMFGIVTDTMMYRMGSPLPVPAGYTVEPFIVVGILLVEENENEASPPPADETAEPAEPTEPAEEAEEAPRLKYMIFAVPDPEEIKRGRLPVECPSDQNPETWGLAVKYNHDAFVHEQEGRRVIVTVDPEVVVRVERLVGVDEFDEIIRRAKGTDSDHREAEGT
jgi:hypothetical protein